MTDDKALQMYKSHIMDLYTSAKEQYYPRFTKFLTAEEQQRVRDIIQSEFGDRHIDFFGGLANSERAIAGFFPEGYEVRESDFPIECVRITGNKFYSFSHRDVLGSLMGLGIKRENIGDITVDAGSFSAYAILSEDICEYVLGALTSVGRSKVSLSKASLSDIPYIESEFEEICDTVSSLRADAVVASVLNISRDKACSVVLSGIFSVNHRQILQKDFEIKENDLISIKGKGRFLVYRASDLTKKGRVRITVRKYI